MPAALPKGLAFLALAAALSLGQAASPEPANAPSGPGNEDLRHIRRLAAPQLSPDGHQVLVQITEATADGGADHLWLIDVDAKRPPRQLTWSTGADKHGERAGRWMPDGRSVLFLAKRGEHVQLYRLPMDGGEAHPFDLAVLPHDDPDAGAGAVPPAKAADAVAPVVALPIDVDDYAIAPDGRAIAIVARDPQSAAEKKRQEDKADATRVDHDPHGKRLYLLDPESGQLRDIEVPPDIAAVVWTPQGDRMMVIAEAPNTAADLGPARTAWLVGRADLAHPAPFPALPPSIGGGVWSADARQFYFQAQAQAQADTPPGYADLYAFDTAAGVIRNLSEAAGPALTGEAPFLLGNGVAQPVQAGTRLGLSRFGSGHPELVRLENPVNTEFHCNARQTGCVWLGGASAQAAALYVAAQPDRPARKLATPAAFPATWTAVPGQKIHWTNEGLAIEGLLYMPRVGAAERVPLVVDVHGGPTGAWLEDFNALAQFLVAQGWAVLLPNPRGSTGYGATFVAANRNDLGGGDLRDIMAGVDAVIRDYPVDARRLALIGYSYGGEMAGFVEGRTDRFKAIVCSAPVIDQHSEYGTEDSSWYDRWFYGKPWEHPDDAWRQSPLSRVAHAVTPFLLLQGEADKTDPLGQSQEMYRALRQAGVAVELVQYPREDHGPLAQGIYGLPSVEPWHGFDARLRIVNFIGSAFASAQAKPLK